MKEKSIAERVLENTHGGWTTKPVNKAGLAQERLQQSKHHAVANPASSAKGESQAIENPKCPGSSMIKAPRRQKKVRDLVSRKTTTAMLVEATGSLINTDGTPQEIRGDTDQSIPRAIRRNGVAQRMRLNSAAAASALAMQQSNSAAATAPAMQHSMCVIKMNSVAASARRPPEAASMELETDDDWWDKAPMTQNCKGMSTDPPRGVPTSAPTSAPISASVLPSVSVPKSTSDAGVLRREFEPDQRGNQHEMMVAKRMEHTQATIDNSRIPRPKSNPHRGNEIKDGTKLEKHEEIELYDLMKMNAQQQTAQQTESHARNINRVPGMTSQPKEPETYATESTINSQIREAMQTQLALQRQISMQHQIALEAHARMVYMAQTGVASGTYNGGGIPDGNGRDLVERSIMERSIAERAMMERQMMMRRLSLGIHASMAMPFDLAEKHMHTAAGSESYVTPFFKGTDSSVTNTKLTCMDPDAGAKAFMAARRQQYDREKFC